MLFLMFVIEAVLIYGAVKISNQVSGDTNDDKISHHYVCDDGDIVKSRGEAMIDNWLHNNTIEHIYERTIKLGGKTLKYDWYLPKYDVYVEYWGFYGKKYKNRRDEKEKLYQNFGKKLISINNADIGDINHNVKEKLLQYLDEKHFNPPKRCFNCGVKLDDRYL
jgi:predicted nuclease of restriction endonuclease-like RecB superfamily